MIESGKHIARAVRGDLTTKGSRGTPVVVVSFRTEAGESVNWDGWLTPAAVDRTFEGLRLCGWQSDDVRDLSGIDTNDVEIVVEHEDYNGQTYPRVKWVNALGGGAAHLAPDTAAAIAAGLKGRAIASRKGMATAGAQASRPQPAPRRAPEPRRDPPAFAPQGSASGTDNMDPRPDEIGDDEIPF